MKCKCLLLCSLPLLMLSSSIWCAPKKFTNNTPITTWVKITDVNKNKIVTEVPPGKTETITPKTARIRLIMFKNVLSKPLKLDEKDGINPNSTFIIKAYKLIKKNIDTGH